MYIITILSSILAMPMPLLATALTPTQQINAVLAREVRLYDDLEAISDFKARVQTLQARKEEIIDREIISHLRAEKEQIEHENMLTIRGHEICEKATARKIALGVGSAALSFAAKELISTFTTSVDTSSLGADALLVYKQQCRDKRMDRQVSLISDAMRTGADVWLNASNTSAKLRHIETQMENLKRALAHDPLAKLEQRALEQFASLLSPTRKRIIDSLLDLRSLTGAKARASQEHIEHCLTIPTTLKRLSRAKLKEILAPSRSIDEPIFMGQSPFSRYSLATQKSLKAVFDKIILNSKSTTTVEDPTSLAKAIFLFYGEPATGKSFAAREITKFFDLPLHTINVTSNKDLKEGRAIGNHEFIESNLGSVYLGFFKTDSAGKNYLNPVLLIDEIDRALAHDHELLGFLHDFFDTNIKTWQANYFGEGYFFDISNLIVIMTANSDLGLAKAQNNGRAFSNADDQFAAIRDRMVLVKFDDFPKEEREVMISDYINRHHLLEEQDTEHVAAEDIATFLTSNLPHETIRQSFRRAEALAMSHPDEWRDICSIDDFADLPLTEKTREAQRLLLNTRLFTNLCNKKVDNIDAHAHDVGTFIARCYPRCTPEDCKRFGFKLSGKSTDVFAKVLNVSEDSLKIAELEQIDDDNKRAWLVDYLRSSLFVAYFSRKFVVDIEDAADSLASTLLDTVTLSSLPSLLRGAEINSEKAWPRSDEKTPERNDGHDTFLKALEII